MANELLANGYGLFTTTGSYTVANGDQEVLSGALWKATEAILEFNVQRLGLQPNSNYTANLNKVTIIGGGYSNDVTGGNPVVSDRVFTSNLPSVSGNTNSQGDLSLTLSYTTGQFWGVSVTVVRPAGVDVDSWKLGTTFKSGSDPFNTLPLDDPLVANCTGLADNGQVKKLDSNLGETSAICLKFNVVCEITLTGVGIDPVTTQVTAILVCCLDLVNYAPIEQSTVTYPISVTLDGLNQTTSPTAINTTVNRTSVPYTKTTERDSIRLDYRIKGQ